MKKVSFKVTLKGEEYLDKKNLQEGLYEEERAEY